MSPNDLDGVRDELRRLGYLDPGLERFFLQDAVRRRAPISALARLAGREALVGGPLVAAVAAAGLAFANGPGRDLADVPVLWLHLLVPAAALTAAAFLVGAMALWPILRRAPARQDGAATGMAAFLVVAAVVAAFAGSRWIEETSVGAAITLVVVTAGGGWALVRSYADGLLAWSIQITRRPPRRRLSSRRAPIVAMIVLAVSVAATLFLARGDAAVPEPVLPRGAGSPVLLVGIDGVLPEEFDYLLGSGALRGLEARRADGAAIARYARGSETPAAFWTAAATGIASPRHGVAAFDAFRPIGVAQPLARLGAFRSWFARIATPLRLAEQRAVLANRRRVRTFWEIEARGGNPVAAINWWATYPADALPGLIVAHGAHELLPAGAPDAVQPPSAVAAIEGLSGSAAGEGEPFAAALGAALGASAGKAAYARSFAADSFYRAVTRWELERSPATRAVALYLPALDILATGWRGSDAAFADLVRLQLEAVDAFVDSVERARTVIVVADPGRRGGAAGRILIWRAGAPCAARAPNETGAVPVEVVASALLRSLGWPQSEQLPEPPAVCTWPAPAARVPSYGERRAPATAPSDAEYLENLRALGYL